MSKFANEQVIISHFCSCCSEYSKLCVRNNYLCYVISGGVVLLFILLFHYIYYSLYLKQFPT